MNWKSDSVNGTVKLCTAKTTLCVSL